MNEPSSFWDHLEDLRKTIIRMVVVIVVGMICSFVFYEPIFNLLTEPFKKIHQTHHPMSAQTKNSAAQHPKESRIEENLIIFSPGEGLMTVLKVSFWVGLVGTSPVLILFLLEYIAPALYPTEKKLLFPLIFFSIVFLMLGLLFAFFVTIPTANAYLNAFNKSLGLNLWGLSYYIDYTLILLLANALAFELFVIVFTLAHFRWISAKQMAAKRKHVIVGIFILSAIFTPPDVLTQLLLAFPLMGFYEAAILYAKIRQRKLEQRQLGI